MGKEEIEDMVAPQKRSLAKQVSSYRMWSMRKSQHCPHGCPGALLAGDLEWTRPYQQQRRTAHDELVRRLAERVPKARLPSPLGSGPYLH